MRANSSSVVSRQSAAHARLGEIVQRHLDAPWRREPGTAGRAAFESIRPRVTHPRLILDAGCGTGEATFALARGDPGALVIGVDKSAARLAVGQRSIIAGVAPSNALLLRCDLVDFWQLAERAQLRFEKQWLLYPNPWPKSEQVQRRWHAHPVLPSIVALGSVIELRTNWRVYADEFAAALRVCGLQAECGPLPQEPPLTPFERKYADSGHALWCCRTKPGEAGAR